MENENHKNNHSSNDYEKHQDNIHHKNINASNQNIKNNNNHFHKKNSNAIPNRNESSSIEQKNVNSIVASELVVDYQKAANLHYTLKCNNKPNLTYIFAVGGVEEIGKNMYAIEHNEETIVVDAGIKFASNDMLGVNGLIPNFDYFNLNNRPIDYLFITHGHEDHIGGIPYLLQKCEVKKICAPLLAAELIKRKIQEFKEIKIPEFEVFDDSTKIKTKYLEIDFFRVCHSIPDCFGLAINTPNGIIVSAGDYRFDFGNEVDNTDIHKIIEISNRKVDVFLAESTNSDQPGFSESEDLILKNIKYLLKNNRGRIFISTFASNLGRIEKIIEIAINLNRKICIMGRSMEANIKTSRKVGYIKLSDIDFISAKEISTTPDENVLVILTGSQGEEMAALNLMAENKYSKISLKPSDTIVLSSNPIPGNFKSVENVVNKLFKLGVNVIQHSQSFKIHASGHATKQEQQMMMKLIKPKYIVPIHGENKMLRSMKNNAIEIGFEEKQLIIVRNGQKMVLDNHVLTKLEEYIDVQEVLIDGKTASKETNEVLEERKIVAEEGIFNVILLVDKKGKRLTKNPMLSTRGCFFAKESSALVSKISYSLKEEIDKKLAENNGEVSEEELTNICKKTILYFIWKNKRKKPFVVVSVFNI